MVGFRPVDRDIEKSETCDERDIAQDGRDPELEHRLHAKRGEGEKRCETAGTFNPGLRAAEQNV
jgi:hypothetical protein